MTHAISGRTSDKPFAFYDLESHSLKTSRATDQRDSPTFSGIVPRMGFLSDGRLYERPRSAPRTSESVSSSRSIPTPMVGDAAQACNKTATRHKIPPTGIHPGETLTDWIRLLPGDWGDDEPVIRHWEVVLGRPAPIPSEPNNNGKPRITVDFDEWLMGLPEGWIDDVDIPYGAKIKLCGNGVVPQQAEEAIRQLIDW